MDIDTLKQTKGILEKHMLLSNYLKEIKYIEQWTRELLAKPLDEYEHN